MNGGGAPERWFVVGDESRLLHVLEIDLDAEFGHQKQRRSRLYDRVIGKQIRAPGANQESDQDYAVDEGGRYGEYLRGDIRGHPLQARHRCPLAVRTTSNIRLSAIKLVNSTHLPAISKCVSTLRPKAK